MEQAGWLSSNSPGPTVATPVADDGLPQVARMYDYYLGGKDHFEADKKAAEEILHLAPNGGKIARSNRRFLHLAVEHLVREQGIEQLLDLGSGIPTEPNTHQIAQYHRPEARVLYADNDPLVAGYAEALLTSSPRGRVDYVEADLRRPKELLEHPCLAGPDPVVDLTRPVGLLVVALFHFVTDEDRPVELLRRLLEPLAPGSFLVLSHVTEDLSDTIGKVADAYQERKLPARARSRAEVEELVTAAGAELVEPGVRPVNRWWPGRPAELAPIPLCTDAESSCYGVLARRP